MSIQELIDQLSALPERGRNLRQVYVEYRGEIMPVTDFGYDDGKSDPDDVSEWPLKGSVIIYVSDGSEVD